MIQQIQSAISPTYSTKRFFPEQPVKDTKSNLISPTYMNDIQSMNTGSIKVTNVKIEDDDAMGILSKEMAIPIIKDWRGGPDGYSFFGGEQIHVYDVGSAAADMGIPLQVPKIIGYKSGPGCEKYQILCTLEGNQTVNIRIEGQPLDKPFDEASFKNVVLKALKITISAKRQMESIHGRPYDQFDVSSIKYDHSTKKADFEALKTDLSEEIKFVYGIVKESNPDFDGDPLEKYLANFYDEFYKTMDKAA